MGFFTHKRGDKVIFLVFSHGRMELCGGFFSFKLTYFFGNKAHFSFKVVTKLLFQRLSSLNSISKFSQ